MGDGCILVNDSGNYILVVRIHQNDEEIIQILKEELSPTRPITHNIEVLDETTPSQKQ